MDTATEEIEIKVERESNTTPSTTTVNFAMRAT